MSALGDRPMLWKELYIERAASLGRVGQWIGSFVVVLLAGGSLVLVGIILWDLLLHVPTPWADWATAMLSIGVGETARFVGWLLEWSIGLRAATTISSERERGTWDALLTSPLSGREIVWGKLWGSLHGMRWVLLAAVLAWTLAACVGAMRPLDFASQIAFTILVGAFLAAVGVRTSLSSATATRAMALTIGTWLVAQVAVAFAALLITLVGALLTLSVWMILTQLAVVSWAAGPWFPLTFSQGWTLASLGLFALLTVFVAGDTSLRFDRLAGRITGGKVAVALDQMVYGPALPPIPVGADGRMLPTALTEGEATPATEGRRETGAL